MLVMKLSKWHYAIAVRSLLRDARALFRCGSRPEDNAQCLSRNTAIGLKTTWASVAHLVAALEDSRRATCKGPLVLHLEAIFATVVYTLPNKPATPAKLYNCSVSLPKQPKSCEELNLI
jgi:hypothetical protein